MYGDEDLQMLIKKSDYDLFETINSGEIIVGSDGWIFDIYDKQSGYNYIRDYMGGVTVTDTELERLCSQIEEDRLAYAEIGAEYILCVIPNSMTVHSDKLPWYMRYQSDNTVLSRISNYMKARGMIDSFVDLRSYMNPLADDKQLYNNTENSINGLGAYYIYDAILDYLSSKNIDHFRKLERSDLEYVVRYTDGKGRLPELLMQDIVKNRTVSLSDDMVNDYNVYHSRFGYDVTKNFGLPDESNESRVLVEFTNEWDKIQLMPYFANSFSYGTYLVGSEHRIRAVNNTKPSVVVRVVREYELEGLLK
jgi:hypothetical protein